MAGGLVGWALTPVRIGFDLSIQQLPEPTGVERAQVTLLEALFRSGADHEFLLFAPGRLHDRWRDRDRVTLVEGPSRPLWFWRESVVPGELRKQRVDVFHSPVAAIPLRARCPMLATIHEVPWAGPEGATGEHAVAHKLRLHLAANFAARLLCVSERTAQQVRSLHPDAASRIRVTPHGLDPSWLPAAEDSTDEGASTDALPPGVHGPWVLAAGRLRHKKNLARLLEAFALRVADGGDEQLVLAGPDDEASDALHERARAPDLAGRVVFPGYVSDAVLRLLYRGASCVVHASLFEGFGLPVIEAMAAGVPVIVSRQGGVSEAIGEGAADAALVVDGEDAADLARGMSRVLDEPALSAALVAAGREHLLECSAERAAARVLAIYEEFR